MPGYLCVRKWVRARIRFGLSSIVQQPGGKGFRQWIRFVLEPQAIPSSQTYDGHSLEWPSTSIRFGFVASFPPLVVQLSQV